MKVLLAQCQNKMENFSKSYELYKEIIQSRGNEIENETDLLSNYFAAYALSKANDAEFLKPLCKYVSSWECYYKDCFDTLKRSKEDFPDMDGGFGLLKNYTLICLLCKLRLMGLKLTSIQI